MSHALPVPALDHLVLPTASLEVARERLARLGFTVSPAGVHPFGTVNCCVYLADGTFLEPLAVADPEACGRAAAEGNVFVARDRAFRAAVSEEGFSAIVLASADAEADHRAFCREGVSAGEMLSFSRPFNDASGRSDTASFRLAFAAAPGTAPFLFTCQRVNVPAVDRSSLERHANGASGIGGVAVAAAEPGTAAGFFAAATGAEGRAEGDGVRFALAGTDIVLRDRSVDEAAAPTGSFDYRSISITVDDLAATQALLAQNGVGFETAAGRIIVPPAPGQGATFIFEDRT